MKKLSIIVLSMSFFSGTAHAASELIDREFTVDRVEEAEGVFADLILFNKGNRIGSLRCGDDYSFFLPAVRTSWLNGPSNERRLTGIDGTSLSKTACFDLVLDLKKKVNEKGHTAKVNVVDHPDRRRSFIDISLFSHAKLEQKLHDEPKTEAEVIDHSG